MIYNTTPNMNKDMVKMVLHFVKEGEIEVNKAQSLMPNAEDIIETLIHMGWIVHEDGYYKLVANIDIIAYHLAAEGKRMEIPFISKIFEARESYMLRIPEYIARTFNIKHGDLLIININNVRVSGTVSGRKKYFYIRKKYWEALEGILKDKEVISCVLEGVYHREGITGDQPSEEAISEED